MAAVAKSMAYIGHSRNQENTITVSGTGDAFAKPDVANFSFTLSDTEKAVSDAQAKVAQREEAALQAVRAAGVADSDITTASYGIFPHYEYHNAVCPQPAVSVYGVQSAAPQSVSGAEASPIVYCPPGKSVLAGYDVSETITVKLRDLSKAGSLLASLGSAGVSNLSGPDFTVNDPSIVQAEARSKAIADARTKANELAGELGVTIIGVTNFYESNGPQPISYGMGAKAMVMSAASPVPELPAGENKVTDNVSVTYEIR